MKRSIMFLGAMLVLSSWCSAEWTETSSMNRGRTGNSNAVLTDGRVVVMGDWSAGTTSRTSFEIFDPATSQWTMKSLPSTSWADHGRSVLLPNGEVLLMSSDGNGWLYDASADNWSSAPSGNWDLCGSFTLLKDGRVLISAYDMSDMCLCALYDHVTNTTIPTLSTNVSHRLGVGVLLPTGHVLLTGGQIASPTEVSEIYDPSAETWTTVAPMSYPRGGQGFVGVLLRPPFSEVLVAGANLGETRVETELFDPGALTWSTTGNLNYGYRSVPAMVLLPCGRPIIMGGRRAASSNPLDVTERCETYDPLTSTWTEADSMHYRRCHFSALILHTGKVLATGGLLLDPTATRTASAEIYDPSEPSWTTKASIGLARKAHTLTPLPIIHTQNCSTNVLIAGGEGSADALKSCELYNYCEDRITSTGELNAARSYHATVLLPSGDALAIGGVNPGGALRSCESYDVRSEAWSPVGIMNTARSNHTATLLKNGDVVVTGGENPSVLSSCEVYSGGMWITVAAMDSARTCHSAVLLLDGRILVVGGKNSSGATSSCEIWDGSLWAPAAALTTARYLHTATLLQSGKVLVAGGTTDGSTGLETCEIYDLDTDTWTQEANLSQGRHSHNATLLYSGLLLTTGGHDGSTYLSSCEIWDPSVINPTTGVGEWKSAGALTSPRSYHTSVLVPALRPYVLTIGGENGSGYLASIEQHDLGLGYVTTWQSTITNLPAVTHISPSIHIEGTLFRGLSEADGGNHCHRTSSDHPIISLVRVGGGNWQGNGGGEILHMPHSSSWDQHHTDVNPGVADFGGYYRLWSIVNGIPCKWYEGCAEVEESQQFTVHSPQSTVFPNPSTSGRGVHFRLGLSTVDRGLSTISIYDLGGRLVRTLQISKSPNQQVNEVSWDTRNEQGDEVESGVYFCRVNGEKPEEVQKLIIVR